MTSQSGVVSYHTLQVSSGKSEFMTFLSKRCNFLVSQHYGPSWVSALRSGALEPCINPLSGWSNSSIKKTAPETDSAAESKVTKTMELLAVAHRARRI